MSTQEQLTYTRAEVPNEISSEAFERGIKFIEGLEALQRSLRESQLKAFMGPHFSYTFPETGFQRMVIIPNHPIERWTWGFKHGERDKIHHIDKVSDPFVIGHVGVKGLTDWRGDVPADLTFYATSPHWISEDPELATFWAEWYKFNPREHQVAIEEY